MTFELHSKDTRTLYSAVHARETKQYTRIHGKATLESGSTNRATMCQPTENTFDTTSAYPVVLARVEP